MLPSGNIDAGASAISSLLGKSGPGVQIPVDESKIDVLVVAPKATTLPSGRWRSGPISGTIPRPPLLGRMTIVLPALVHLRVEGSKLSELVPSSVSTVSTLPLGRSAKPSSEKPSALPLLLTAVHVRVVASNNTWRVEGCAP